MSEFILKGSKLNLKYMNIILIHYIQKYDTGKYHMIKKSLSISNEPYGLNIRNKISLINVVIFPYQVRCQTETPTDKQLSF